jgi:hypothetical protein
MGRSYQVLLRNACDPFYPFRPVAGGHGMYLLKISGTLTYVITINETITNEYMEETVC